MGRERLSREVLTEHQRDRVLAAATTVFAKRGYQATTVDNIVAAAKIGVGSFYALFDGKEDCFLAVYDRSIAEAREQVAAAVLPAKDWSEEAFAGLRSVIEIFVAEPLRARIALIEAQTAGATATARYNEVTDAVVAWLRRGRDLYPDATGLPSTFEQAAVAGMAWFLQQRLAASEPESMETLLSETAQMILEPIVGPAEAARHLSRLAAPAPSA